MLQLIDYYKILQVDPEAHPDVVRAAYRVLARVYHPDVEGGSAERMVALNNAWSIISDEITRAAYDRSRAALAPRSNAPTPVPTRDPVRSSAAPSPTMRSSVLDFGRYQGWTLEQVARRDPDFLEWLSRMPIGRPYRTEIENVLATVRATAPSSSGARR
jgi:curved DNA-binding protein CbpA